MNSCLPPSAGGGAPKGRRGGFALSLARLRSQREEGMTPFRRCAPPSPADGGRHEFMPPPVCGGRCPEGAEGGLRSLTRPPAVAEGRRHDPLPALRATFPRRRGKA